jgi:hypothetical protein
MQQPIMLQGASAVSGIDSWFCCAVDHDTEMTRFEVGPWCQLHPAFSPDMFHPEPTLHTRHPPLPPHLSCLRDDHHPVQVKVARQLVTPHLNKHTAVQRALHVSTKVGL